jgi:hypothetical protein
MRTTYRNGRDQELVELARSGIFRAYSEFDCAGSVSMLHRHGYRPATYQEILSRAYGSSRRASRFRDLITGSFYINGWGIDDFEGGCLYTKRGELAKLDNKLVDRLGIQYDADTTVRVIPGYMPLMFHAFKERLAVYDGYRFTIDGNAETGEKASSVVGINDDGKLDGMLSILLRR